MKKTTATDQVIGLIASQIEAASSLLKFAADDLAELLGRETSIFADELLTIVRNMQAQAATLDGNVAFLTRLDLLADEDESGEESEDQRPWMAQG